MEQMDEIDEMEDGKKSFSTFRGNTKKNTHPFHFLWSIDFLILHTFSPQKVSQPRRG